MCMLCKCDTVKESTTTHVVNYKGCVIVIKNVPCEECEQCGEKFYTDEVAERLESMVDAAKKLMQEISVIDYSRGAEGESRQKWRFSCSVKRTEEMQKLRAIDRPMTTPLFLLRCVQLGISIRDLDLLTIGMVNDMYVESGNDQDADKNYRVIATQADFDRF